MYSTEFTCTELKALLAPGVYNGKHKVSNIIFGIIVSIFRHSSSHCFYLAFIFVYLIYPGNELVHKDVLIKSNKTGFAH